jgi:hypothetical protein
LDSKNITSARLVKKLDNKFYGLYQIKKVLDSYSYKLKLLDEFGRTYRTFYPSLLMPTNQPSLLEQVDPLVLLISIDKNGELL